MDYFLCRSLTLQSEAVSAGLQPSRNPGPISLTLIVCFGHDVTAWVFLMIPLQRAGHACALPDPGDKDAQMHLCQCGWLSNFFHDSSLFLSPPLCTVGILSQSGDYKCAWTSPPLCLLARVCMCCQVFFCKDSLFAWGILAGEGVCVYVRTWVGVNSIWGEENLLAAYWLRCVGESPEAKMDGCRDVSHRHKNINLCDKVFSYKTEAAKMVKKSDNSQRWHTEV